MSHKIEQILQEEGLAIYRPKSITSLSAASQKAALDLFRFFPEPSDPRWSIAILWATARQQNIKGVHEETVQIAKYLSTTPSYRNGYCSFSSEENLRLIARASINLSSVNFVQSRFEASSIQLKSVENSFNFALTNRITLGTNGDGTTGCPESLYQIQLRQNKHYLGRIGFNIHHEAGKKVVSISNVQGVPQGKQLYEKFEQVEGVDPFISLIERAKTMFPDAIIRGVKNPSINPSFYNTLFVRTGITRYNHLAK